MVMEVLTDTSKFEAWDFGTIHYSGEIQDGSRMSWTPKGALGTFRAV